MCTFRTVVRPPIADLVQVSTVDRFECLPGYALFSVTLLETALRWWRVTVAAKASGSVDRPSCHRFTSRYATARRHAADSATAATLAMRARTNPKGGLAVIRA
jgi:hypothetical protein